MADPAYSAHMLPIRQWAEAVWSEWLPIAALLRLTAAAKKKLAQAKSIWQAVTGPGAAFVASCARLGWTVTDATLVTTDSGDELNLRLDSPAEVAEHCRISVQRWRWRNIQQSTNFGTGGVEDHGLRWSTEGVRVGVPLLVL